jgi:acetyltransferase-like isoleucine patch superfamily enzyme
MVIKVAENVLGKVVRIGLRLLAALEVWIGWLVLLTVGERGNLCRFEGFGRIHEPEKVRLGTRVAVGRNFFFRGKGGITIGDYTRISRNVTIHTVNHNMEGATLPYDRVDICKPVKIGSFVWIGMNVNILPGVTIGDGAVIGMGTTISRDVAPGEIVVGGPQRVVGTRDKERTAELVRQGKFLMK